MSVGWRRVARLPGWIRARPCIGVIGAKARTTPLTLADQGEFAKRAIRRDFRSLLIGLGRGVVVDDAVELLPNNRLLGCSTMIEFGDSRAELESSASSTAEASRCILDLGCGQYFNDCGDCA